MRAGRRCVLAVMLASACSGERALRESVSVRDSSGVRIVENRDVAWSSMAAWSVPTEPLQRLGAADADPGEEFHRVAGGVLLGDDRAVVADGGSQEIRWYGPSGARVARAGGRGQGPGEFSGLAALARMPGDSVLAYDVRLRRFTVLGPAGRLARVASLDVGDHVGMEFPSLEGVLQDGTVLLAGRIMDTGEMEEGPVRAAMPVYTVAPHGRLADSLRTFHGWEATVIMRRTADFVGPAITARPFDRSTSIAALGSGFAAGTPIAFEYEVFDPRGVLTTIVRLERPPRTLGTGDIEEYTASIESRLRDEAGRRALRRQADDWVYPETVPAYGAGLIGDGAGNVWVPGFTVGANPPLRWSVFDRAGRYLGDVDTPARVEVLDISDDRLLGLWRDAFDVEHVHLYAVEKP
jgi:hypothetical protein